MLDIKRLSREVPEVVTCPLTPEPGVRGAPGGLTC